MASREDLLDQARVNVEPALDELLELSSEGEIRDLLVSEGIRGVPWVSSLDPISMFLNKRKQGHSFLYETELDGMWGESPIGAHVNVGHKDRGIFRVADFSGALFSFWEKFENEEYPELVNQDMFERAKRMTGYAPNIENDVNHELEV